MMDTSTYTCDCGKSHGGMASAPPPGWEWRDGKLLCDDCTASGNQSPAPQLDLSEPASAATVPHTCPTAIRLLSGGYLDLADPDCSIIQPMDIAAGLRQGRFSGQTRQFYTIAQHCLLVLRLVSPVARQIGGERGLALRRCALMHDAPEAFIHDITRPLKIILPDYRRVEAVLDKRLCARFGVEWTGGRHEIVKRADMQALAIEQRDLKGIEDPWPVLANVDREALTAIRITRAWHPDEAEEHFLRAFDELFSQPERMAA